MVPLGLLFFPFAMLVMIGASNAVNLTDGLDGLAIVPTMIVAACYALIAYLVGNAIFAEYLGIPFVPGTGELAVFCGALVGASLGFLWFNAPPAMVFMGDTGSLASGGALGAVAVITKHELVLARGRRPVRARDDFSDRSGRLVQAHRQTRVPHGAAAPPLRAEGLGGADDRDPVLDHRHGPGPDRPVDPEAAVATVIGLASMADRTAAVLGLSRTGRSACRALTASGARVWAWDDDPERRREAAASGIPIVDLAACDWDRVDRLVLSPGVPLTHPQPHPLVRLARAHRRTGHRRRGAAG